MTDLTRRTFVLGAPVVAGGAAVASAAERRHERISDTSYAPGGSYPIRPKPFTEVKLQDGFWAPKVARNAEVTIPFEFEKLGAVEKGLRGGILEGAIFTLQTRPDPKLRSVVEQRMTALASGKSPVTTNRTYEVAISWYKATGDRRPLDRAIANAAALYADFQHNDPPFNGGERDSLACAELYKVTGDKKHLDLAKHWLDIRGRADAVGRSRHNQSYKHVLDQREAVGHAVNGVTLMLSLVDVGMLTGLKDYYDAGQAMWSDAASRKLYITGGVGVTGNEGFGEPYVLPNISAYAETCAVLMFMTLNHRLFLATGDSRYIDVMERGMYNNAVDGVSAAGHDFFYVNRLASAGDGRDHRWQHAALECCPPNLVRFLASMPGAIYAQDDHAIYVNLYVASSADFATRAGKLGLAVESDMPWAGTSRIKISAASPVKTAIRLRIPGWAMGRPDPAGLYAYADSAPAPKISINGKPVSATSDKLGYVAIDRAWANGDVIEIDLPMQPRRVRADARVREAKGRVAIERGPIVYCAEFPDTASGKALDLLLDPTAPLAARTDANFYGGAVVIETSARRLSGAASAQAAPLKLIPYHLWANRGVGEMSVWLNERPYAPGDVGPAGGLIFYENPNHAKDGWRYLEAAPFDQSLGAQWGKFRHAIAGTEGTAIGTGKQNTAAMLAAGVEPGTAAQLCSGLSVSGVRGWFLPSRDELAELYRVLAATGVVDFHDAGMRDNATYWTSSQDDSDMAKHIDFADNGRFHGDDKDFPRRVRAIRAI